MLPSLCKHCAKQHLNKNQQTEGQEPERNVVSMNIQKQNWPLFTSARKKLNKSRDNENDRSRNPDSNKFAMHLLNNMAYDSNSSSSSSNDNDQPLQCNKMTKTQSSHIFESSTRNGASMLIAECSQMNGINNDDVNTSHTNGALDVHRHGRSVEMQSMSLLDDTTMKPSSVCMPLSTLRCSQCYCNDDITTKPSIPLDQPNSFSLNVHDAKNPTSFSENVYRSATNYSNLNGHINSCASDSSFSIRKPSGNYFNNQRRKNHVNHQWPFAISSTMNISHVLLICITFMAFGARNAFVLAENTAITTNITNQMETTESGSKYHIYTISFSYFRF